MVASAMSHKCEASELQPMAVRHHHSSRVLYKGSSTHSPARSNDHGDTRSNAPRDTRSNDHGDTRSNDHGDGAPINHGATIYTPILYSSLRLAGCPPCLTH
jgi:hypothetical protein